jgi:hypothetical protein
MKGKIILENGQETVFMLNDSDLKVLNENVKEMQAYRKETGLKYERNWDIAMELAFGAIKEYIEQEKRKQEKQNPGGGGRQSSDTTNNEEI